MLLRFHYQSSQESGGRRQEAGGRRQEAGGRRQEAGGRRFSPMFWPLTL
ncbi:MAG: hypothetical protein F6K54_15160 [Okeania sp. SIO3B5]|nr:hypothetical protein [Okeania sp. SIO3B5]NEO54307.1 hypothetical protein [Okeania sp. SIO3B5]